MPGLLATCPSATVPNGCVPLSCRFRCPCRAQTSELSCAPARLRAFPRPGCGRCTAAALGRPSRHQVDVLPLSCCCPPSFFRYPSSPPETAGERRESRGTRRCMPKKATFFFKGRGKKTVPYFKLFFIFVLLSPLDPKKKADISAWAVSFSKENGSACDLGERRDSFLYISPISTKVTARGNTPNPYLN